MPEKASPKFYKSASALQAAFDKDEIDLNQLMQQLQARELLEAAVKREREIMDKAQGQAATYKAIEEGEILKRNAWENCPHVKENGKTALGGQTVESGKIVLVCLHCQKTYWDINQVPHHLRPEPAAIGLG